MIVPGLLLKNPDITIKTASLASGSLEALTLSVIVHIENPNFTGMKFTAISFDVTYRSGDAWTFIAHGEQAGVRVPKGASDVAIPVTIKNSALPGALLGTLAGGGITLKIEGTAALDLALISPKIPFSHSETVPLKF
ncbi:MAG: LEA type 2 family protein [Methanoregula sp.]|nr:LEA type 2 family protein [Methanoregula sp.]